jgi:hypothetical protein
MPATAQGRRPCPPKREKVERPMRSWAETRKHASHSSRSGAPVRRMRRQPARQRAEISLSLLGKICCHLQ